MRRALILAGLGVALVLLALWLGGALSALRVWAEAGARAVQRELAAAVRALVAGQAGALAGLLALCFGYGVFHAAGPGHGKLLVGSYGLARRVPVARLAAIALASSLAQSTVAVGLVLGLVMAFGWARASVEGLAEALFLPLSHGLIAALALWLIARGLRGLRAAHLAAQAGPIRLPGQGGAGQAGHPPGCACGQSHGPSLKQIEAADNPRAALALIAAIALRPCSGALFLLVIAWQTGILAQGILGVYAMGLGTALVTVAVAVLAGWSREGALAALPARALPALERGQALVELMAGAVILAVALPLLVASL
ncbi:MAG: hypothetical protein JNN06_08475 [Gemmobacter sp.]|uniref:nickel/cobalt transporter n=1 Tax=Gemmobacter sp. TaxID=1898957 RepID=UPI001A61A82B|nr:hypothetical protein [Gemmobacter sp.]MBL8562300.1 hypothetical protein [Gemmobacter sp.]